ncbi:DUF221-domain-containing protein [Microthyrium microscopicum]|uniref:DUF221-domain-containing protein n=1 Tax=Microthyrium microscopicum TaxID=703497 RepID=A0A6A6UJL9_9PEZI|nr:DUF221-domain-containing protein [Microthyrium microscopicum]
MGLHEFLRREFASELVKRVDQSGDKNIGSANGQAPVSASQLLSTLAPVALVAIIWLAVFMVARPKFGWNYSPRASSWMLKSDEHSEPLPNGIFAWFSHFWAIPDTLVLQRSSLDAYFFLRFLKMSVIICLVGAAITWPVLFPVNATGGGISQQLDILTFANCASNWRYYAHVGCAWLFFGFILILITRESIYYINLRQAYLMNPAYASKLPARTVLYTAVPAEFLDETKLRNMLGSHVKRVWFPTDTDDLDDLVKERTKAGMKLEGAETKLIMAANGERLKAGQHSHQNGETDAEVAHGETSAERWITPKQRPTHRLGLLGLIGKKVESIPWARSEIERLDPIIAEEQARHRSGSAKKEGAVFVEFDSLSEAQAAFQSLTHHQMMKMAPRYTGMHPREVIWKNLKIKGPARFLRKTITLSIVVATVVYWSVPVAFVGALSNIRSLIGDYLPWLSFLLKIPTPIFGVVQGLLPVVLLALLMSLLPPFLRWMAKLGGAPTTADVEYTVSNYFFAFQVVQVFLVTTLTSAAAGAVSQIISNPSSAISLLRTSIPKSNNFYLSYIILQGLGVFSGTLAAVSGLVVRPLLAKFLGKTPRSKFIKWNNLKAMKYGTVFPVYTGLLVIAIVYAPIAPLVTGLSALGLFLFYFAYRYNILYVYTTGPDTKGLLYPRALQQLFVGLYLAEICLVALIAVALGSNVKAGIGPLILGILLVIVTALYHISLNAALAPLLAYLPKSLDAEERLAANILHKNGSIDEKNDLEGVDSTILAPKHPRPNMLTKFLKPHIYCDYATMRRLMPKTEVNPDEEEINPALANDAYLAPGVWNELPRLIVPRDPTGISGQEVRESGKVVPITDAGATLDEKNKMVLDNEKMHELYFKEKVQAMGYEL